MRSCFEFKEITDSGRPGMFWDYAEIAGSTFWGLWLRAFVGTVLRAKRLGAVMV